MLKPSLIVAVKSNFTAMEAGAHDVIRGTWGGVLQQQQVPVKFFLGRTSSERSGMAKSLQPTAQNSYNPKKDEVIVECPDEDDGLVWKTRAICKWFVDKAGDHILIVDYRSVVYPELLWKSGFQRSDYTGRFNGELGAIGPREIVGPGGGNVLIHDCDSWADGGGYFLSKQAAMIVAEKIPIQTRYILGSYEDFWVGQILGPYIQMGDLLSRPLDFIPAEVK
jgi:hypothetical protein